MWSFAWLEHLMQDIRYGARALRRSPGFATVAALTLALSIGATTAIFTVVNGVILRPLPYKDADRVVMLWETTKEIPQIMVSYPNYLDWRTRVTTLDGLALYNPYGAFNLTGDGDTERISTGLGTGNLFDVLGVQAAIGRTFRPEDDVVGAARVAILTDGLWRRRFGADTNVLGETVTLDGEKYTIVGVLPERVTLGRVDIWAPIGLWADTEKYTTRENHPGTIAIGRVKPGVTLDQVRADLSRVSRQLEVEYPTANAGIGSSGEWFLEMVVGDIRRPLYLLLGSVGLVLLIACANIANLLLGRATARQREMALRLAIGAKRGRIVKQLVTENLLLSLVGGALGVGLAWVGVRVLLALRPANIPRLVDVHLDGTVLAFAFAVSLVTGLVFGLVPALQSAKGSLVTSLKDGAKGATASRMRLRMRSTLMVAEVAIALVLLVGAGLLMRSFAKLTSVDPGVDPRNVVAGLVQLPTTRYPDTLMRHARFAELLERAKAIPGVTDAALASDIPTNSSWQAGVTFDGMPPVTPGNEPILNAVLVTPEWFSTMRMRVIAGRSIAASDVRGSDAVVVISEAIAKRYLAGLNPVGRQLRLGPAGNNGPLITIVGVVNDVKDGGLGRESRGTMYFAMKQRAPTTLWLAVRSTSPKEVVVPQMRSALATIDKDVPLASIQTLEESIDGSVAAPRFSMLMLGIFAAIALVLAAVGIYGVISYSVAQRTHEIGVRVALGAQRLNVLGMVIRQALVVTGLGIAIGTAGALAAGTLVARMLFGVAPTDPATFTVVALGLAMVSLIAAAVPAWRAMRLDPIAALRE